MEWQAQCVFPLLRGSLRASRCDKSSGCTDRPTQGSTKNATSGLWLTCAPALAVIAASACRRSGAFATSAHLFDHLGGEGARGVRVRVVHHTSGAASWHDARILHIFTGIRPPGSPSHNIPEPLLHMDFRSLLGPCIVDCCHKCLFGHWAYVMALACLQMMIS